MTILPPRVTTVTTLAILAMLSHVPATRAAPALDDPPVSLTFQLGSGIEALNLAISEYLSKRPGLTRYAGFKAEVDGIPGVLLPLAFTGTIEQLVKSIACINGLSYRDFTPEGVVFMRPTPDHPIPVCPMSMPKEEVQRKAATLPGAVPGLNLPGRRPGDLNRLFPGYTKPGPTSEPLHPTGDGPGHAPEH